jgi:DNA-binding transcriptional ArsR family regulator
MSDLQRLARFYQALSDETRLRLVALLARQRPCRAACVTRLAQELDTTMPNVSQHLRILKDLGLVRGERRGLRIHYFLDGDRLAAYQKLARDVLGEGFLAGVLEAEPDHPHPCETELVAAEDAPEPSGQPAS